MASCGWKEAAEFQRQQDASEAFTFITSTLALPLLTLKMDIFHTGREDASDDHKFINERLLELAVPEEPSDGHTITLEECLELFFNNKIEVKRYLDSVERRNTLNSIRSHQSFDSTKVHASHVEIAEIDHSRPPSPSLHPAHTAPIQVAPVKPSIQRRRAPSIIQEHYIDEKSSMLGHSPSIAEEQRGRTGRVRKEVIMPAWQFFSLIPWYTNSMPSNDAQVAAHFSSTRPILGICLKRYSMLPNGTAIKRKTRIDIPLEIGLPHFIQDDKMTEDGPAFGNFKLSLQSVVCHQGLSVESGHYISLVRSPDPREQGEDMWMRFDDLAEERVTHINIEDFLRQESPYLLFYQVIPIEGEPGDIAEGETPTLGSGKPPAYSQSTVSQDSKVDSGISGFSLGKPSSGRASNEIQRHSLEVPRPSIDSSTSDGGPQGRSSIISERPQSAVFPDNSASSVGVDLLPDPKVDNKASDISGTFTASRRDSRLIKASSSKRPNSRVDDKRISTSLSRLANRMSGDKLNAQPAAASKQMEEICPHPTVPGGTEVKPTAPLIKSSDKPVDRAKIKKEAKEKSKASHRAYQNLNKGRRKDGKPDRECSIM